MQNMFFNMKIYLDTIKKGVPLHRYPENNLFTLKKLIPIENLKRVLWEKSPFFYASRHVVRDIVCFLSCRHLRKFVNLFLHPEICIIPYKQSVWTLFSRIQGSCY